MAGIAARRVSERHLNPGSGRLHMSTAQPPTPTAVYPDRSERLMVAGILQVLLGCLCGLMALFMLAIPFLGLLTKAPQPQGMNTQTMIQGMVFYVFMAVVLIWLGIGLALARRWAWTLTVVLSWVWLTLGVFGVVLVILMGPMMSASIAQEGKMPPEVTMIMAAAIGAFTGCFYILLPGGFLLLCQSTAVRATCVRRDPKVPWTDRCPMPVLPLSITHALLAISMPLGMISGSATPLFGVFLSGPAGTAVMLLIALLMAYLAWGTYRLKMAAWWGMLLVGIAGGVNTVFIFSGNTLMTMYEKVNMPPEQLELMRKTGFFEMMSKWGPWMSLVGGALWLGYLLYVRRYFIRKDEQTTETW
jgi:hypothetical protein